MPVPIKPIINIFETGFAIFKSNDELQKALKFLEKNNLLTDGLRFDVTCARNKGYKLFKSGR